MIRHLVRLFALTLLAGALFAQTPAKDRMLVVISLDGFPAYALDDPALPVPALRKLAERGSSAARMTVVDPSVTWPSHTALSTGLPPGAHGVYYNGSLFRNAEPPRVKVVQWVEKDKMVKARTIYDAAFEAGLTTAEVDWVAIYKARTVTWPFPEIPSLDGAVEREMLAQGLVTRQEIEQFGKLNIFRRDEIWTAAAAHIIRAHKPNLLLYHLLSLDSTHHTYGPKTMAGMATMAFVDGCVERLLNAIEASGMADRTTVVLLSDHGFKAFRSQIQPTAALAAAGLGEDVEVVPEGGTAMVYLNRGRAAEVEPRARKLLAGLDGVAEVVGPADYARFSFPDPAKDAQVPDLVLVAKDGFAFAGAKSGPALTPIPETRGSHGYPASDPDMDAIFIAAGAGIRPGVRLERIHSLDVAPTLAALLGVKLPTAARPPLKAILQ